MNNFLSFSLGFLAYFLFCGLSLNWLDRVCVCVCIECCEARHGDSVIEEKGFILIVMLLLLVGAL